MLCGLQNDASKNEMNKDMLRLKKQVEYWKEQAGLSPEVSFVLGVMMRGLHLASTHNLLHRRCFEQRGSGTRVTQVVMQFRLKQMHV